MKPLAATGRFITRMQKVWERQLSVGGRYYAAKEAFVQLATLALQTYTLENHARAGVAPGALYFYAAFLFAGPISLILLSRGQHSTLVEVYGAVKIVVAIFFAMFSWAYVFYFLLFDVNVTTARKAVIFPIIESAFYSSPQVSQVFIKSLSQFGNLVLTVSTLYDLNIYSIQENLRALGDDASSRFCEESPRSRRIYKALSAVAIVTVVPLVALVCYGIANDHACVGTGSNATAWDNGRCVVRAHPFIFPSIDGTCPCVSYDNTGVGDVTAAGTVSDLTIKTAVEKSMYLQFLFLQNTTIEALPRTHHGTSVLRNFGSEEKGLLFLFIRGASRLRDISAVAQSTDMRVCEISDTPVLQDVSPLGDALAASGQRLELQGNNVSNITALGSAVGLTSVYLLDTVIKDISSLANMPRLGYLDIRTTPLQDLSPLAHLGQFNTLTNLIILQTQVADLTPLAKLTSVVILFLHNNRISDVSALQSLHPQHLYLQGNSELEDVMPLMSLTNLLSLNLASTRLSVLPAAIGKLTALTYEERQKGDVFVVAVAFMAMCKVG